MTIDPAAAEVALIVVCVVAAFWIVGKVVRYFGDIYMDRD